MIAILGVGRVGAALGPHLSNLGYQVVYGAREPGREDVVELVEKTSNGAQAVSVSEACQMADWVVVALPYSAMESALHEMGDLDGKIVVDVTNALVMGDNGLMKMALDNSSSAEQLQASKPDAKVVKAFNTVGFHVMANPAAAGGSVSVPLAGNDADAKIAVAEVIEKMGLEAIDVGPIEHARSLESMAVLYLVPYLQGRMDDAFEFYFRRGASPKKSKGVRAAG